MATPINYQAAGVDYTKLDPVKVSAQVAARETSANLLQHRLSEVAESRGESAYVVDAGDFYIASITECLGTKALVADAMRSISKRSFYDQIAQDTIAMAVNDLITVGATPVSVHAYWAAANGAWFGDQERAADLIRGWKLACDRAGVAWGGGETPGLVGVIQEDAIDLAASSVGLIRPKQRLTLGEDLQAGDAIVLLESSGIHANGVSLARAVAKTLANGYATVLPSGRLFGEALLDPTIIYVPVTEALAKAGVHVHYCANITGHGWLKIMRHAKPLSYHIHTVPPVPEVLQFITEKAQLSDSDAYSSLNMGAGFAIFVKPQQADQVISISQEHGIKAYHAGLVKAGAKSVVIEPKGISFAAEELKLRA